MSTTANSGNSQSPLGNTDLQSLQFAVKAAGLGMWDVKLTQPWTIVWDDRCRELFGVTEQDVTSYATSLSFIHPDDREAVDKGIKEAMDPANDHRYEVSYRTIGVGSGQLRWVRSLGNVFFDAEGIPVRFSGISMDITTQMQAMQQAARAENLANVAIKGSGIGLFHIHTETDTIEYSPAFARILTGETGAHLTRADFIKHIYPEDQHIRAEAFDNKEQNGELYYDARTVWHDGTIRWIRTVGTAVLDEQGKPLQFSGTVQDITDQKERDLALKTAQDQFRSIVEQAPVAIGLLNGADLIVEQANETILKLWGKDESVLGRPLAEALPEIRTQGFLELLQNVYETGVAYYGYSALAKINHDEELQNHYFDFVYYPIRGALDKVTGIMVLATEVTTQVHARQELEESELRFRSLIEEATVATTLLVGLDFRIEVANEMMLRVWGKDSGIIGSPLLDGVPELRGQQFLELLTNVYTTGIPYAGSNEPADLMVDGSLKTFYFDFTYKPIRNAAGEIYAIMNMAVDVTEQVLARKKLEESELFARSIIYNSPVAKMVFIGKDMVIDTVNENMLHILGRDIGEVLGKPLMVACPELKVTPIQERLEHVLATGATYYQPEEHIMVMRHGEPHWGYYNYIYKVLVNTEGAHYGVMGTATEVTEHVNARLELEASQNRLRSLVESAPFPIGVYTGRDMIIELANQTILDVWGKGNDVIGKSYREILPELQHQEIFQQLDQVYMTGNAFSNRHQRVDIQTGKGIRTYYFNYDFTPLHDASGKVYGVMNTAADVTDLVSAKQLVEQTEASLRGAIELAELGTWNFEVATGLLFYSERMNSWFGFGNGQLHPVEKAYGALLKEDFASVNRALQHAITPGTDGLFDVEYTVVNQKTGYERMLHAQGKALYDEQGKPYRVAGTAQDVTSQRKIQLALEQQVQERTEELQTVNEELTATNEELHESNDQLQHSNEELAQYAYVASHDLQEPLRKIRMFSDMLGNKPNLSEDHRPLVEKISQSSERMTLLIRDLLEFSRLLKSDMAMRPIKLSETFSAVVDDFELTIREKNAQIEIGMLPVIDAVSLQMNQLFYNLLSNALKFTKPATRPLIKVSSEVIPFEEAAKYVQKPSHESTYHRIIFSDNGIGFDTKYSEQIFEVFKRLHGKDLYPGSGIGLALCRRIVANHNGHLYTISKPGIGTTFYIILPDVQQ